MLSKNKIGLDALNHDQRILGIQAEMVKMGKECKNLKEWKVHFNSKGYLDDETDLAYLFVMNPEIGKEQERVRVYRWKALSVLAVMLVGATVLAYRIGGMGDGVRVLIFVGIFVGMVSTILNFSEIGQKLVTRLFELDFGAEYVEKSEPLLKDWKAQGCRLFEGNNVRHIPFRMIYDNRETYLFDYGYEKSLMKKHPDMVYCTLVIQKTRHPFPAVGCWRIGKDPVKEWANFRYWDLKSVQLEGVDFHKEFNVYSESESDAFYLLNPRFMGALMGKKKVLFVATFGGYLAVGIEGGFGMPKFQLKGPPVLFSDYQGCKKWALECLDIATNLNDVLSREIVDDGSKRNDAKIR